MMFSLVQTSTLKYTHIRVYLHTKVQPVFMPPLMDSLLMHSAYVHFNVYSVAWPLVPSLSSWLIIADFHNFAIWFLKSSEGLFCS